MVKVVITFCTARPLHFREDSTGYASVYRTGLSRVAHTSPVNGNRACPIYCVSLVFVGRARLTIVRQLIEHSSVTSAACSFHKHSENTEWKTKMGAG